MSRKVFTAGEVLAAADVNNFLMNQTVMSFAGTASRTASIPTPVTGMYTHLEDSAPAPRLEFWNGSAWVSPFGLTLLNTTSFTAQSLVDITNVFSADFDSYRIVVSASLTTAVGARLQGRLLLGASPVATNYLSNQVNYNMGGAVFNSVTTDSTAFSLGFVPNTGGRAISFDLVNPFLATATGAIGNYVGDTSGGYSGLGFTGGFHNVSTSYNGFRILPTTSTMTGTIRIYGYRNS